MTISELIARLEELRETAGEVDVVVAGQLQYVKTPAVAELIHGKQTMSDRWWTRDGKTEESVPLVSVW